MTRWPGWARAWAVTAVLAVAWGFGLKLSPHCNFHGRCLWYSDLTVFLLGGAVLSISLLVALAMSLLALWRGRRR